MKNSIALRTEIKRLPINFARKLAQKNHTTSLREFMREPHGKEDASTRSLAARFALQNWRACSQARVSPLGKIHLIHHAKCRMPPE